MTIERYINTLPYIRNDALKNSKYFINGETARRNRGELLESIAKWHRGEYCATNPTTSWEDGSDIESIHASVKSSEGSLGRQIGGYEATGAQKISTYFKGVASKVFIWMTIDEDTQIVTEYQMNKSEFGKFIRLFTRYCHASNRKEINVRFKKESKEMIRFLEAMAS